MCSLEAIPGLPGDPECVLTASLSLEDGLPCSHPRGQNESLMDSPLLTEFSSSFQTSELFQRPARSFPLGSAPVTVITLSYGLLFFIPLRNTLRQGSSLSTGLLYALCHPTNLDANVSISSS